jgi:type II secretory pathway component PulK
MVAGPGQAERGAALLIAIVALALVATSVTTVAVLVQSRIAAFRMSERDLRLDALVDSAMAEALAQLSVDRDVSGVAPHQLDQGTVTSRITRVAPGIRSVVAEGRLDGWVATIDARVDLRYGWPRVVRWERRQGPG